MTKGPQGPRTKGEILNRMITLALGEPRLTNKEIQVTLEKEFPIKDVPCLRTIQQYVKNFREEAAKNVQEQPWSIGIMAKEETGIPWEAAGFLLEAYLEIHRLHEKGQRVWSRHPLDNFLKGTLREIIEAYESGGVPERISVKPLAPRPPPGTVLTVRQAKWLWWTNLILSPIFDPAWPFDMRLSILCDRADPYVCREIVAHYIERKFDTSDLDGALAITLMDARIRGQGIHVKKEVHITQNEEGGNET